MDHHQSASETPFNGVSLAGRWWPAFSAIWILFPLIKQKKPVRVGPPLAKLSGSAHELLWKVPCIHISSERQSRLWAWSIDIILIIQMVLTLSRATLGSYFKLHITALYALCLMFFVYDHTNMYLCTWLHCWICLIHIPAVLQKNFWNKNGLVCHSHRLFAWEMFLTYLQCIKQTLNHHAKSQGVL